MIECPFRSIMGAYIHVRVFVSTHVCPMPCRPYDCSMQGIEVQRLTRDVLLCRPQQVRVHANWNSCRPSFFENARQHAGGPGKHGQPGHAGHAKPAKLAQPRQPLASALTTGRQQSGLPS